MSPQSFALIVVILLLIVLSTGGDNENTGFN